ncbi:hypothetical protein DUNSADRAFT_5553 [Dunaliella salina]|uniref:Encoded protein n=1 Tax=Dunaliella salina TaxID=3046 RepID=A0ABQ7FV13_DUNSA|nr:hypothetical protein DUNSADRAFT_5553 [Dunaliella salina]|eukprot:KAF5825986.1 hypothetical protein DUNSADRAFT_5553 [Dunaliella salina]
MCAPRRGLTLHSGNRIACDVCRLRAPFATEARRSSRKGLVTIHLGQNSLAATKTLLRTCWLQAPITRAAPHSAMENLVPLPFHTLLKKHCPSAFP